MTNSRIALLVISCDNYSDLWDTFFFALEKNWSDCPYTIFLQSNHKELKGFKNVKTIKIGNERSWSDALIKSLKKLIDYDYVLIFMEDMIISNPVNTSYLLSVIDEFLNEDGNYLTLINEPKPNNKFNKYFGELISGSMYRVTTTASLWKTSTLREILDDSESAWQFEKIGSRRSDKFDKFYSVYKDCFDWIHLVVKGKVLRSSIKKLKAANIELKTNRKQFSFIEEFNRDIYRHFRKHLLRITPKKFRKIYTIFK